MCIRDLWGACEGSHVCLWLKDIARVISLGVVRGKMMADGWPYDLMKEKLVRQG